MTGCSETSTKITVVRSANARAADHSDHSAAPRSPLPCGMLMPRQEQKAGG